MTLKKVFAQHFKLVFNDQGKRACQCGHYIGNDGNIGKRHRKHAIQVLEAHMLEREAQLRQLVRDMTDPGACWFDHHGGCQEHGYLDLKTGELCPHAEAKQLLGDEPNGR